jgi:hypothetical protein
MNIDLRFLRRSAAGLLAGAGAVLAFGSATSGAQAAQPLSGELRSALSRGAPGAKVISPTVVEWPRQGVTLTLGRPSQTAPWMCDAQLVCLYQDANGRGRKIAFKKYGTYKLAAYGMGAGRKGVSSYYDNQTGSAGSTLIGPGFRLPLRNFGNVPRSMNDRATYIRLYA